VEFLKGEKVLQAHSENYENPFLYCLFFAPTPKRGKFEKQLKEPPSLGEGAKREKLDSARHHHFKTSRLPPPQTLNNGGNFDEGILSRL
jgi:hypothetical protein